MALYDESTEDGYGLVAGVHGLEFSQRAVNAFCRAALDDMNWAGDEQGTGEKPGDPGAYMWDSPGGWPFTEALSDVKDGAGTSAAEYAEGNINGFLEDQEFCDLIATADLSPEMFGDRLYYSVNGAGTGLWDISRDEAGRKLHEKVGHWDFQVEYRLSDDYEESGDITLMWG